MKRALFKSVNLIGDSLYVQPALEEWAKDHPDWQIDVLTIPNHVACLYEHFGIPNLRTIYEPEPPYDFEHNFICGGDIPGDTAFKVSDRRKCHIATSYGIMLGYELGRTGVSFIANKDEVVRDYFGNKFKAKGGETAYTERRVKFNVSDKDDHEKGLILCSMFSASCASQERCTPPKKANKMISWLHWLAILPALRQRGRIAVIGGLKDRADVGLSEDEYMLGTDLETTARMMRDAKLLVTVDNGMGHLAATQQTPTLLFYPKALGLHYIVPSGNPNLRIYHMDPANLNEFPVSAASTFVREGVKELLRAKS